MRSCLYSPGKPSILKFLGVLIVLTLLLAASRQYGSSIEQPPPPQSALTTAINQANAKVNENAYVFYATNDAYACSVLVNIHILRKTYESKHRMLIFVSKDVSSKYRSAFKSLSAEVIQEKPMDLHAESNPEYHGCLLKLAAFRMHEIDPSLKRLLIVEADQLVLKNLDHLFDLPPADIYAPKAYWLSEGRFSSTLMLVQPKPEMWKDIQEMVPYLQPNQYEADVVNDIFAGEVVDLADSYVVLNDHWSEWSLPPWFTPGGSATEDAAPASAIPSQKPTNQELDELSLQSHVIHFSAVGKPWTHDLWEVGELEFEAHEVLHLQWEEWRVRALTLCPAGVIDHL
ncbi:alphaN-acetylglucosamine transferase [Fusarium albosuccineum]|uniref:AlphaN-acetylglucosamine transferase n=1 Tax=Fusarium albosuccineum TaxID=1237068 RepID=A0A8H4PAG3_9HYPO|nr:alphaN-acetylglucosamine transferase [Fusarium albosuccineum]